MGEDGKEKQPQGEVEKYIKSAEANNDNPDDSAINMEVDNDGMQPPAPRQCPITTAATNVAPAGTSTSTATELDNNDEFKLSPAMIAAATMLASAVQQAAASNNNNNNSSNQGAGRAKIKCPRYTGEDCEYMQAMIPRLTTWLAVSGIGEGFRVPENADPNALGIFAGRAAERLMREAPQNRFQLGSDPLLIDLAHANVQAVLMDPVRRQKHLKLLFDLRRSGLRRDESVGAWAHRLRTCFVMQAAPNQTDGFYESFTSVMMVVLAPIEELRNKLLQHIDSLATMCSEGDLLLQDPTLAAAVPSQYNTTSFTDLVGVSAIQANSKSAGAAAQGRGRGRGGPRADRGGRSGRSGRGGNGGNNRGGSDRPHVERADQQCSICRGFGHGQDECPSKRRNDRGDRGGRGSKPSKRVRVAPVDTDINDVQ